MDETTFRKKLQTALESAYFPNTPALAMYITLTYGAGFAAAINWGLAFNLAVFETVNKMFNYGFQKEFVIALHSTFPQNSAVSELYALVVFAVTSSSVPQPANSAGQIETVVRPRIPTFDMGVLIDKLTTVSARVCLLELGDKPQGTGFLVGPDVIMTNWHVVEPVLHQRFAIADLKFRFDYRRLRNGDIKGGKLYAAGEDGILDFSEATDEEFRGKAITQQPRADQLDYALVRVAKKPGNETLDEGPGAGVETRGWIPVPNPSLNVSPGDPLLVVQHPGGDTLKIAIDTDGVRSANANGTRIQYTNNTNPGASGSPCFDADFKAVALHHMGDVTVNGVRCNQGVPLEKIRAEITRRKKNLLLG